MRPRRIPLIAQGQKNECGLACLAMVLHYHGHRVDMGSLRTKFPAHSGLSAAAVITIANEFGLSATPLRLEPEELRELQLPALLHWNMNHYVVLTKVSGSQYSIHDPEGRVACLSSNEICKYFTGIAIELTPSSNFKKSNSARKLTIGELWKGSADKASTRRDLALSLMLSILLLLFSLILPFYSQTVIDELNTDRDTELVTKLALGFLFITATRAFTELIRSSLLLQLGSRLSLSFATNIYQRLIRLNFSYFLNRHIGDITSRFHSISSVREFISSGIVGIVIDGLLIGVTLTVMFMYSATLSYVALIAVFIYALLKACTYQHVADLNSAFLIDNGRENTVFIENIRAIQGIKLFGKERERTAEWLNSYTSVINAGIALQKMQILVQFANGLLLGVGNILLIFLAALAVLQGELTIGMLVAYLQFKDQFYSRIFTFLDKLVEFKLLDVHLERLSDVMWAKTEDEAIKHELVQKNITVGHEPKSLLTIEDITFRYSADSSPLFENLSLDVREGEVVAIVGPTGSGKSTLLKVILSLLTAERGNIKFQGIDIKALGVQRYRSQIAAILQDDCLLSGTILENIAFFESTMNIEKAEAAAKAAGIHHEIVAMPMQYNTSVGNMGGGLSAGQVQRIMLARALYKDAKLLITDEATSHLDVKKESEVMEAFSKLGTTRIIVAHRPTSIMLADRVFELTPSGLRPVEKDVLYKTNTEAS